MQKMENGVVEGQKHKLIRVLPAGEHTKSDFRVVTVEALRDGSGSATTGVKYAKEFQEFRAEILLKLRKESGDQPASAAVLMRDKIKGSPLHEYTFTIHEDARVEQLGAIVGRAENEREDMLRNALRLITEELDKNKNNGTKMLKDVLDNIMIRLDLVADF